MKMLRLPVTLREAAPASRRALAGLLSRAGVFACSVCLFPAAALAIVPEHCITDNGFLLAGVGPDNPIIWDNDWWFDVFDNNYLLAQASLGAADLRGNIVTCDMWDWKQV